MPKIMDAARIMVQYMGDSKRIRLELLARYNKAPSVARISALRGAYLTKRGHPDVIGGGVRGEPIGMDEVRASTSSMEIFSADLLKALWREHPRILTSLKAVQ